MRWNNRMSRWTVTIEQELVPYTTDLPTIDERWRHIDTAGHEHCYDHGYPTLRHVIDATHWCDGNEGIAPHDPHEHIDESHYECAICGETITPAVNPAGYRRSMPGIGTATAIGITDGTRVTMYLTEHDVETLFVDGTDADGYLDVIARTRPEQVLSWEIG